MLEELENLNENLKQQVKLYEELLVFWKKSDFYGLIQLDIFWIRIIAKSAGIPASRFKYYVVIISPTPIRKGIQDRLYSDHNSGCHGLKPRRPTGASVKLRVQPLNEKGPSTSKEQSKRRFYFIGAVTLNILLHLFVPSQFIVLTIGINYGSI